MVNLEREYAAADRDAETGCWSWTGCLNRRGYGHVRHEGRVCLAHRVSYESNVGPIPAGLVLDHLCRNPACVNPEHLEPVTQQVNCARGIRGSQLRAGALAKTHCLRGHALTGSNVRITPKGWRACRACHREHVFRLSPEKLAQRREYNKLYSREWRKRKVGE